MSSVDVRPKLKHKELSFRDINNVNKILNETRDSNCNLTDDITKDDMSKDDFQMSGFMMKKSDKMMVGWQKRYFICHNK
jgi:hypothetical protein